MIAVDAEAPEGQNIFPAELHTLKKGLLREEPCVRGSKPKSVSRTGADGNTYSIFAEGMYYLVPPNLNETDLKLFISEMWTKVVQNMDIKNLYFLTVMEMSKSENVRKSLIDPDTSPYWKQFRGSLLPNNISMVKHSHLDEVFTDEQIPSVCALMLDISFNRAFEGNYSEDAAERHEMTSFAYTMGTDC